MKRIAILALALLMLAGCGTAGPVETPAAGSPGPNVLVHWDALPEREGPIAERWYPEYTDTLIPSDEYGELVRYIGGEGSDNVNGYAYNYGLATRDGVIVTDPVYLGAGPVSWYDQETRSTVESDTLLLHTAVEKEIPPEDEWSTHYENRYGLAASDGSWTTGQIFAEKICEGECGVLFFDTEGNVVMMSLEGEERFRWPAGEIPIEGLEAGKYSFFYDIAYVVGPYMTYTTAWNSDGTSDNVYVDLRDGTVLDSEPEEVSSAWNYPYDGWSYYTGGRYKSENGVVTIEADGGGTHSFPVPQDADEYFSLQIDGDRVIANVGEGYRLLDLDGNELHSWGEGTYPSFFYINTPGALIYTAEYNSEWFMESDTVPLTHYTVYDRDGNEILSADGVVQQYGDRLIVADREWYRLCTLEGEDLLRISRVEADQAA